MNSQLLVAVAMTAGLSLPLIAAPAGAMSQEMRHITMLLLAQTTGDAFAVLDANRDGRIDPVEAARDLAVADKFGEVDTDGDGFISPEEWMRYHRQES